MTLRAFLKRNRAEIDRLIEASGGTTKNDEERRLWVVNDESLYRWALRMGVNV